jgi:hypothetical protein
MFTVPEGIIPALTAVRINGTDHTGKIWGYARTAAPAVAIVSVDDPEDPRYMQYLAEVPVTDLTVIG